MKVVGFDISTYTGMCLLEGQESKGKCVHFADMKGHARLVYMRNEINFTLDVWQPELAVIESYAFGNKFTLATLVSCGTIIRCLLFEKKIPWVEVNPAALKKFTTGSNVAKKPEMAAAVKSQWGYTSPSDDIVDAFALAKMGQLPLDDLLKIKGVKMGL